MDNLRGVTDHFVHVVDVQLRQEITEEVESRLRRQIEGEFNKKLQEELAARDKKRKELSPDAVLRRVQSKLWVKGDLGLLRDVLEPTPEAAASSTAPRSLHLIEQPPGTDLPNIQSAVNTDITKHPKKRRKRSQNRTTFVAELPQTKLTPETVVEAYASLLTKLRKLKWQICHCIRDKDNHSLSLYQVSLLAARLRTAVKTGKEINYGKLATTAEFRKFEREPDKLQVKGHAVLSMMEYAWDGLRGLARSSAELHVADQLATDAFMLGSLIKDTTGYNINVYDEGEDSDGDSIRDDDEDDKDETYSEAGSEDKVAFPVRKQTRTNSSTK